jgi:hypothetical protein
MGKWAKKANVGRQWPSDGKAQHELSQMKNKPEANLNLYCSSGTVYHASLCVALYFFIEFLWIFLFVDDPADLL